MHPKLSLNLNHLQHFLAIADQGSLRAAADALGLSQPAMSKSLRALESVLGAPLIQRNARGSTLTPCGELLYGRARLIENEMQRVSDEIQDLAGIGRGRVALGASAVPSLLLIPRAIERFHRQQRSVRLDLVGGMPSVLLPRLLDGSLDFVVGPRPTEAVPELIDTTRLLSVRGNLVVHRGHPLEKARSIQAFAEAEWVLSSSAAHAESALHAAFKDCRLPPANVVIRVESLLAAYSIVAETQYVGLLPNYATSGGLALSKIAYVDVPELNLKESYELFVRRGSPLSSAASRLIANIEDEARRLTKASASVYR